MTKPMYVKLYEAWLNEAVDPSQIAVQIQKAVGGLGTDEAGLLAAIKQIPDATVMAKVNQVLKAGTLDPKFSWSYSSIGNAINSELGRFDKSYRDQILAHVKSIKAEAYLDSFKEPPPPVDPIITSIKDRVVKHEGMEPKAYLDSKGIPTIGVGFNLLRKDAETLLKMVGANPEKVKAGKSELNNAQITTLLYNDLKSAKLNTKALIPNLDSLPQPVQGVLTEMTFNLGKRGLSEFKNFLNYINRGEFSKAADEMLRSSWAKQVGERAKTLSGIIKSSQKV